VTPVVLQIALPDQLELSPADLARITGKPSTRLQMKWLESQGWAYTLDLDKGIVVGTLYAHLRLAGLHPAHVTPSPAGASAGGFTLGATR
jgi:hypothetical protein